jgi:small membrane protein
MIIQVILIVGLLLCLAYAFLQRQKSRLVSVGIAVVAFAAIYFVLVPERTNQLAHLVGVGRGADLILYCWLVISLIVSVNLQFKILRLQGLITDLAREMTLRAAQEAPNDQIGR